MSASSPWLNVQDAADRARCGCKCIYRAVARGRLRAVKVDGRGSLRLKVEWIDEWLEQNAVVERRPQNACGAQPTV